MARQPATLHVRRAYRSSQGRLCSFTSSPINTAQGEKERYYLLLSKMTFSRTSKQKNFSAKIVRTGKTVLYAEITCDLEDNLWRLTHEEVFQTAKESLPRLGHFALEDVDYWLTRRVRCAYPVHSSTTCNTFKCLGLCRLGQEPDNASPARASCPQQLVPPGLKEATRPRRTSS